MASWGIAEWYGSPIESMSSDDRKACADLALGQHHKEEVEPPECPFMSAIKPGSPCNKEGGVCSIRPDGSTVPSEAQPAVVCPSRFLSLRGGDTLFAGIADFLYDGAPIKVLREVPFLQKRVKDGVSRGAKAGRIDWIIVPNPPENNDDAAPASWLAVETQSVYFSGGNIWEDVELYASDPGRIHKTVGNRRPDFRSSGAKRLAPQLQVKSPVMGRWGNKMLVVVDRAFADDMANLPTTASDLDNSEIVWMVLAFDDSYQLFLEDFTFTDLASSVTALQGTDPVNRSDFNENLKKEILDPRSTKLVGP